MALYGLPDIADAADVSAGSQIAAVTPYAQIFFGPGVVHRIGEMASGLGALRPAVLCTPGRGLADGAAIAGLLPGDPLIVPSAVMHTPVHISDAAAEQVAQHGADLLVSVGGGSAVGLGKALTKRLGLKHIAIPTTYAGSEMTPILGETKDGDKLTIRDDALRPCGVIYDPELMTSLPGKIAAASGMNAMAHALEALTVSSDPDIVRAARRSIDVFADALPSIVAYPDDSKARTRALYAAWLAAYCLAEVPMALHHKLCHALGGAYDMPHALTHAAVLPHSIGYNLPACPEAQIAMRGSLGDHPARALFNLVSELGLPTRLADLGLPEDGIAVVARAACANPYANPRAFDEGAITELLRQAWLGARPKMETSHA